MSVRAKFRCDKKTTHASSEQVSLTFYAVTADEIPENQRYHKYTPSGTLEIAITNPAASDQFVLGKCYYLDFTPVD